eukprot:Pgem_evm1s16871
MRLSLSVRENFIVPEQQYRGVIIFPLFKVNETDEGGFFWWVHNAHCCMNLAEHNNLQPIFLFNRGYYYDAKLNNQNNEDSWWYSYFSYPKLFPNHLDMITKYKKTPKEFTEALKYNLPHISTQSLFCYTSRTFTEVMRNRMGTAATQKSYKKFFRINPAMTTYLQSLQAKIPWPNPDSDLSISVHYRGTDKFFGNHDKEDLEKNKHANYEEVFKFIQNIINKKKEKVALFVASDEKPFVEYMQAKFQAQKIPVHTNPDAYRSPASTSGIDLGDTTECRADGRHQSKKCQHWGQFQNMSIHRGQHPISNFQKGRDALMDVLLLSNTNIYIPCQKGNFSSQPLKLNDNVK